MFGQNDNTPVGVLTKPDRIPVGDENSWLSLIKNEKESLENNWYCVKQPGPHDLKKGITWIEARKLEDEFFSSNQPWNEMDEIYQRYLRTGNLVDKLSSILSDLISKRYVCISVLSIQPSSSRRTYTIASLKFNKSSRTRSSVFVGLFISFPKSPLRIHGMRYLTFCMTLLHICPSTWRGCLMKTGSCNASARLKGNSSQRYGALLLSFGPLRRDWQRLGAGRRQLF